MRENQPIAYISKVFCKRNQMLPIYEELLAILYAVSKWRHYLEGASFIIKTDQENIKHMLDKGYFYATAKRNCQTLGVKLFHKV